MIPMSKAIIYVGTMMIELFHAFFAIVTMKSPLRFNQKAVKAKVFKIYILIIRKLQKVLKVLLMKLR
jgi:hypothetical protein